MKHAAFAAALISMPVPALADGAPWTGMTESNVDLAVNGITAEENLAALIVSRLSCEPPEKRPGCEYRLGKFELTATREDDGSLGVLVGRSLSGIGVEDGLALYTLVSVFEPDLSTDEQGAIGQKLLDGLASAEAFDIAGKSSRFRGTSLPKINMLMFSIQPLSAQ